MKTEELELLIKTGTGVLPNQALDVLKDLGFIKNSNIKSGPASLDIALADEIYEIDRVMLPRKNETVLDLIKGGMNGRKFNSNRLDTGKLYMIAHSENLRLPSSLYGYANPKSTTGRNFNHTRMISDFVDMFDHLPREHRGRIWSLVQPKTWPITFEPNKDPLNQLRIFVRDSRVSEFQLMSLQQTQSIMRSHKGDELDARREFIRGGDHGYLLFSLDCESEICGYVAKENSNPVPIGKSDSCKAEDYFEPIKGMGYIDLEPGRFYILSSVERVQMPDNYAGEVKAIDERLGEFRSHLAGFFDPGFGKNQKGNNITLEVYVQEKMRVRHGQLFCSLHLEKMAYLPESDYAQVTGNYKTQHGPRLARNFF